MARYDKVDRTPRGRRRLKVSFGLVDGPERSAGFTEDVSAQGMFLQSGKIYPPRTRLVLRTEIGSRVLELTGRVVWAKKAPLSLMGKKRCGMGIRLDRECAALGGLAAALGGSATASGKSGS